MATPKFLPNPALPALLAKSAQMVQAMEAVAEQVAEVASAMAPVGETGRLQASVRVETDSTDVSVVAGDDEAFYAPFVIFGTSDTSPNPFLTQAAEQFGRMVPSED